MTSETTYDINLEGVLLRVDEDEWERFALDNGAPDIASAKSVVGRPFADFFAGPARDLLTTMLDAANKGTFHECQYEFRCDAPHRDREMEMHVAPLVEEGKVTGLRFRSIVLRERERFGSALLALQAGLPGTRALLKMCSYCKRVEHAPEGWMNPRDYESQGYPTEVAITHGVCPACDETYIQPILRSLGAGGQ